MATFPVDWRAFHLPKKGYTPAEYEDAFAAHADMGRFAIADGASESAFAAAWAQNLVQAYVRKPGPWSTWQPAARKRWRRQLEKLELPWWAETKIEEGAFAALLGITFNQDGWVAEAVGDSCLFRVRNQRSIRAFPIRRSGDFGNRPSLLGSWRPRRGQPRTQRLRWHGDCRPGDTFFLMTDALAQWFLTKAEDRRQPWQDLQAITTQDQFVSWLEQLRATREVRNDDVTLICIGP